MDGVFKNLLSLVKITDEDYGILTKEKQREEKEEFERRMQMQMMMYAPAPAFNMPPAFGAMGLRPPIQRSQSQGRFENLRSSFQTTKQPFLQSQLDLSSQSSASFGLASNAGLTRNQPGFNPSAPIFQAQVPGQAHVFTFDQSNIKVSGIPASQIQPPIQGYSYNSLTFGQSNLPMQPPMQQDFSHAAGFGVPSYGPGNGSFMPSRF